MKNKLTSLMVVLAVLAVLPACKETLIIETKNENPPVVESFTPKSATIGSVVTLKGKYLNNVETIKIGDVEVPMYERVSDTQISFVASSAAKGGKVTVTNPYGSYTTEDSFTYTYAVPSIIVSALAADAVMGDQLLISGNDFNTVESVNFTADGHAAHQAAIKTRTNTEIVVKVPYVESGSARITLVYYNGTSTDETALADAPSITIIRYVPTVTTTEFARTAVGRAVTIEGTNLDKIENVLVGGFEAVIGMRSATSLAFAVPAGNFADGDNITDIVIKYFDGNESKKLTDSFIAYVPMVKYWEGMKVWAQGRDVEAFASFFSPETGIVYNNSLWRTSVDPVSYANLATTCSAANVPNKAKVTESDYNSVNPYFFFSGVSAGHLQINGPANSGSQLKNFYFANVSTDDYRVTGVNGSCYGTPVIRYRYLDPANPAELEIINKVINNQIEVIDEKTFPIDVTAMTIAGVGVTSASGGLQSSVWCKEYTVPASYSSAVTTFTGDKVIMVLYYNYDGSASGTNFAQNIKRIGLLHIRTVNFRMYNNTLAPSSSDITFNCYWEKYDYDYSKL